MIAVSRTEGEYFPTQAREAHRPGVLPGGTVDGPCRGGCGRALGRGFSARPGGGRAAGSGRPTAPQRRAGRSEERRVGEEGRSRGAPYHLKKKKRQKARFGEIE